MPTVGVVLRFLLALEFLLYVIYSLFVCIVCYLLSCLGVGCDYWLEDYSDGARHSTSLGDGRTDSFSHMKRVRGLDTTLYVWGYSKV